jgi:hypothetical protein
MQARSTSFARDAADEPYRVDAQRASIEPIIEDGIHIDAFERADIRKGADDARVAGAALVGREPTDIVARIKCGTAGTKRVRLRRTAVA